MITIEKQQDRLGIQILASSQNFENKGQLLEKLQTTLDLERLLSIYADVLKNTLNLDGLTFASQEIVLAVFGSIEQQPEYSASLYIDGSYLGQLVYYKTAGFSAADQAKLARYHQQLVFPLRNALLFAKVKQQAIHDHMTGIGNRIVMEEDVQNALAKVARKDSSYTLILLDLDGFKAVNDKFGHLVGDKILKHFVQLVTKLLRGYDKMYRYGGDEFVILMQEVNPEAVQQVFKRIQEQILQDSFLTQHQVGCSAGAVKLSQQTSYHEALEQADQALYQAKSNGRGQLCFHAEV